MDVLELQAFFSFISSGKQKHVIYGVLRHPIYGRLIFRAAMGSSRFKKILRFICFNDKEYRKQKEFAQMNKIKHNLR